MAKTKIEWATDSWNPIRAFDRATGKVGWYCEHATPGCEHCYSEALNRRLGTRVDYKRQNRDRVELYLDERMLKVPLSWHAPRRVFVCSMTDLFAEFVPDEWLDKIHAVMACARHHTFVVLTKRTQRMRNYLEMRPGNHLGLRWALHSAAMLGSGNDIGPYPGIPLPNVWYGASVEDQPRADLRIPDLLMTSAAVRWISGEPLLDRVDIQRYLRRMVVRPNEALTDRMVDEGWSHSGGQGDHPGLDWVVVGGESGPGARPMHPDWARSLRDQCIAAGVPFFLKQRGEWLDADHVWAAIVADELRAAGKLRLDEVGQPMPPELPPLNFQEAEVIADGRSFEHHSDGSTLIRVGKKRAGRLLDGREWNEYPREEHGA